MQMLNTERPIVAIYTRTASPQEPEAHQALAHQKKTCLECLNQRYGEDEYEYAVYDEGSASGRLGLYDPATPEQPHRPVLTRLVEDAKNGELDAVCVASVDRLARSMAICARLFEEHFSQDGIELIDASSVRLTAGDEKAQLPERRIISSLVETVSRFCRAEHIRKIRQALHDRRK